MGEFNVGQLKVQGENLRKAAEEFQINFGPLPVGERNEDDFNMKYPPDDEQVSRLPYAIRGAKRFLSNLVSLEVDTQVLEPGLFYSWNGLANQWEPALSIKMGVEAIGYAIAENRLQFWGLAPVRGVTAGQKVYLSASLAGHPTTTRTRHILGVGVSKGTAFLDTLRGLLK